jgi:hypothetical protein
MEIQMKNIRVIAVAALVVAGSLALHVAQAQQAGAKRTELQRRDLSMSGARSFRCASISSRG